MSDDPLSGTESQITLTRSIDAPLEDVFAAWTDPAILEQWQADEVENEPYEGGNYRYLMDGHEDDPGQHTVAGEYLEFTENQRLVMSWVYKGPAADEEPAIFLLEVDFKALDPERTAIIITERGLAHTDPQSRIFSIEAWSAAMEHLAELME